MSEIKAILFDFGGTLDHDGVDWFSRIYRGITVSGVPLDKEVFQRCAEKGADAICGFADTSRLTMAKTVERLCTQLYHELSQLNEPELLNWDPSEAAKAFVKESTEYLHRNLAVIRQMHERYRLGCISNNWGNAAGWCEEFHLSEYFEVVIDSTLVGAEKPNRKIFQAALDQLNLPPASCVYVGDRFDCDIVGAHRVGLVPVWITNGSYSGKVDNPDINPYRIGQLSELLDIDWQTGQDV